MTTVTLATDRRTNSTSACKPLLVVLLLVSNFAYAGFDHEWALDQSGIWSRHYQTGLEYGVIAVEVAGSLWFGNDDPLGHTFWQTLDASAISGVGAVILKRGLSRARPNQGGNPNQWFKGSCCESFPSGEVTLQAGFVTPFIANYARQNPWVWTLEALPVYDGIARMKSQAHWQTDVIAGWLLGSAVGYWTTTRETPFSVQILPRGVSAGFYKRF
ncbi:MAG TPA: phosphatase PAP2 family protein [Steroidobacteraceae bacterium]|nr:phosphatase PAP2 family protein [Steroidobacteraceae bacterium]